MNKILILGPTCSGKTSLSIFLSKITGYPIINFDICQFYKNSKILSCSPSDEEKKQAPHYLFNFLENHERFSIFQLQEYLKNFSNYILVGGNFFYGNCLVKGVPDITISSETKLKINNISDKFKVLSDLDPNHNLNPNDQYRINRALEVFLEYNKPLRSFYKTIKNDYFIIAKKESKDIEKRTELFFQEAVREIKENGYIHNFRKTIGYLTIWDYLNNKITEKEAIKKINKDTYNYSKSQKKWFKHFDINLYV